MPEIITAEFPKSRAHKKKLLEHFGYAFGKFNEMYTHDGIPIRCLECKKHLNVKTIGYLSPRGHYHLCSNTVCIVMNQAFQDDIDSDIHSPSDCLPRTGVGA